MPRTSEQSHPELGGHALSSRTNPLKKKNIFIFIKTDGNDKQRYDTMIVHAEKNKIDYFTLEVTSIPFRIQVEGDRQHYLEIFYCSPDDADLTTGKQIIDDLNKTKINPSVFIPIKIIDDKTYAYRHPQLIMAEKHITNLEKDILVSEQAKKIIAEIKPLFFKQETEMPSSDGYEAFNKDTDPRINELRSIVLAEGVLSKEIERLQSKNLLFSSSEFNSVKISACDNLRKKIRLNNYQLPLEQTMKCFLLENAEKQFKTGEKRTNANILDTAEHPWLDQFRGKIQPTSSVLTSMFKK